MFMLLHVVDAEVDASFATVVALHGAMDTCALAGVREPHLQCAPTPTPTLIPTLMRLLSYHLPVKSYHLSLQRRTRIEPTAKKFAKSALILHRQRAPSCVEGALNFLQNAMCEYYGSYGYTIHRSQDLVIWVFWHSRDLQIGCAILPSFVVSLAFMWCGHSFRYYLLWWVC